MLGNEKEVYEGIREGVKRMLYVIVNGFIFRVFMGW